MKTRVIFRKFKSGGDIIALFPHEPGTNDPATMKCYQHIGQHGSMKERSVSALTVTAVHSEYENLLAELKSVGYDNLDIRMNLTAKDYSIRKKAIELQSLPSKGLKSFTVIGYYPDTDSKANHHVNAKTAGIARVRVREEYPEMVIVDILAGHHMSLAGDQ